MCSNAEHTTTNVTRVGKPVRAALLHAPDMTAISELNQRHQNPTLEGDHVKTNVQPKTEKSNISAIAIAMYFAGMLLGQTNRCASHEQKPLM